MAITPTVKRFNTQQQGAESFSPPCEWTDTVVTGVATNKSYDVTAMRAAAGLPLGQPVFIIFSADGPFWCNFHNTTATIPSGDIADGSSSEFAPNQRYIDSTITQLNFITAAAQHISMQIFTPG